MSEKEVPLPPASFEFLVMSLMFEAQMAMGMRLFGTEEGAPEKNLPRARHTIDLLGILQEKTKGNLSLEEQRLIDNGLTELRFRFVQALQEKPEPKPDENPSEAAANG